MNFTHVTGSSESPSELSPLAESTTQSSQSACVTYWWQRWFVLWAFFKTRLLCGKQGNLLWERKIGEATHAVFSSSSPYFSVYFALFSLLSLFFMKGNFVHFVVLTTLKRGFALSDDGYRTIIYTQNFNIAEPLKKKKNMLLWHNLYIEIIGFCSSYCRHFFLSTFSQSHPPCTGIRSSFYRHSLVSSYDSI